MKKIYYITRTVPENRPNGGSLIRYATIKNLNKFYDVKVITTGSKDEFLQGDYDMFAFSYDNNYKYGRILQTLGIVEDYLASWVEKAFNYLKNEITEDDLLFCTSGGELGCIMLGAKLKIYTGAKMIINYHDPVLFTSIIGPGFSRFPHINRDVYEKKYLDLSDKIITSCEKHKKMLIDKYGVNEDKVITNYFGFTKEYTAKTKKINKPLKIVYAGAFGKVQAPEILAEIASNENIEVVFIGDNKNYKPLEKYRNKSNIIFYESMEHSKLLNYMDNYADVGFVCLDKMTKGLCVPSKIYDYINLNLPILGYLPEGDAVDIINMNTFGVGVEFGNHKGLKDAICWFNNENNYIKSYESIKNQKSIWSMEFRVKQLISIIEEINGK